MSCENQKSKLASLQQKLKTHTLGSGGTPKSEIVKQIGIASKNLQSCLAKAKVDTKKSKKEVITKEHSQIGDHGVPFPDNNPQFKYGGKTKSKGRHSGTLHQYD